MNKPKSIHTAVNLIFFSAFLGFAIELASFVFVRRPHTVSLLIGNVVTVLLMVFIAYKISSGRNWARILLTIIYIFGVVTLLFSLVFAPELYVSMQFNQKVTSILQFVIHSLAIILLFRKNSTEWIKLQKSKR